jgi:hypothetical protein
MFYNNIIYNSTLLVKEYAMNHPFFILSIAALALFYGILFLSILRDVIRIHFEGGSGKTPRKPIPPSKKYNLTIRTIVLAHWITGEANPATPLTLFEKSLTGLMWSPSLSVN